jgi:hypothetical protein
MGWRLALGLAVYPLTYCSWVSFYRRFYLESDFRRLHPEMFNPSYYRSQDPERHYSFMTELKEIWGQSKQAPHLAMVARFRGQA